MRHYSEMEIDFMAQFAMKLLIVIVEMQREKKFQMEINNYFKVRKKLRCGIRCKDVEFL